jgi:hypothetical protein
MLLASSQVVFGLVAKLKQSFSGDFAWIYPVNIRSHSRYRAQIGWGNEQQTSGHKKAPEGAFLCFHWRSESHYTLLSNVVQYQPIFRLLTI